jgi:hypothetical protein
MFLSLKALFPNIHLNIILSSYYGTRRFITMFTGLVAELYPEPD